MSMGSILCPGMTTPGSHGGSCPASVRRSDGGCGALRKYGTVRGREARPSGD
ncbi:hypothetical protein KCH_57230 [Kitasatospora cheerisanensis KCTC 2395]|uniref:Uncharacterized protein n=1 Tax=Kitasatospora cheerisanensis KCTC 2395 TaxID=1348663 RepID=A0A066YX78_9ACTN|nr:hypothetical protein KCH_57230 [Kitasatospora cheerisanensis KCTC 2395]